MLKAMAEDKTLTCRYADIMFNKEEEVDNRSGDEIAADIIIRAGLKFKEGSHELNGVNG